MDLLESSQWAFPDNYAHVATEQKRRLDIMWTAGEVGQHDNAKTTALANGQSLQAYIKQLLNK